MPPPAQRPAARTLPASWSRSLSWSSAPGFAATGRRLRTPGQGPKAVVKRWAPRALTPLPARRPSTTRGGLCFCGRHLDPVAMARVFLTGKCSRGARCWGRGVHVGHSGSAGVKRSLLLGCARVMGTHSLGILFAGRRQRVLGQDSVLLPKAFWRISYKV